MKGEQTVNAGVESTMNLMNLFGICADVSRPQNNPGIAQRPVVIAALVLLLAVFSGCGGGGSGGSADTTPPTFAGVKSSSSMATSITLTWTPASDNVMAAQDIVYLVYRASTAGGENYTTPTFTTARGALSYDDTGLAAGSIYYYVVRAMDGAGNIDSNTKEIMGSTDTTPPTFAGATGAAAAGTTSVTVSWAAATDNITTAANMVYEVYRATISGGEVYTTPTATTAAGATSYTDTGLTSGKTYYYVVLAKDQAGNLSTTIKEVSAAPTLDTTAPTFAGATGTSTQSSSSIAIGWNAATDNYTLSSNIVYLVYRATTPGGENYATPTATTAAGALSYTDSGLSASTPYYYVVRAKDEAGNIDTNTVEKTVTTNAVSTDTTPPTFAGANSLTLPSSTSRMVSWSAATDNVTASSSIVYLVYRATASGGENYATPTATTAAGATSYTDSGLTAGTKYYYVVRAKDLAGNIDANTVEVFGPVSFLNDIYNPIISSTCISGCHATGTVANYNLAMSTASQAYTNLVNVTSGECASEKRVAPGSSSTSYLYYKLSNSTGTWTCGSGSQMPKTGTLLNTTQLNTVKAWIDQGAPNN